MTRRRLQDLATLVNEGVSYRAVILPDGTIKLYLDPGVSLSNVQYSIVISDASAIQAASGGNLQNLQSEIYIEEAEVYSSDETEDAPMVIAGKILAIAVVIITFAMLIFGLSPLYLLIEAIQFTSLFAYTESLPPNLFYFLKEMRLARYVFMPSIFYKVYESPSTYYAGIPQKIVDTEGELSFAINGTGFFLFIFFYLVVALVVFVMSSKFNTNRPLKDLSLRVWETRIKYGIICDFLWLFTTNTLLCAFVQYYDTNNPK